MRWQVSLQLTIGLGALFGLAYAGVERFLGPPLERSAVDSADAHAMVGASKIASTWERIRTGRRALIRELARSPALKDGSSELVEAALESAVVQMGGGIALLVRPGGEKVAAFGAGADELAHLKATTAAHGGVASLRFEQVAGSMSLVSSAPAGDGETPPPALVLASRLGEPQLRYWMSGLPEDTSVILLDGGEVVASTLPTRFQKNLEKKLGKEITIEGTRFRTARHELVDDTGHELTVVGVASVQPIGSSAVMERARLLVLTLGAFGLALSLVLILLAPGEGVRELIEEFNEASRDLPRADVQPLEPLELLPEPALEAPPQSYYPPPLGPPAPSFSSPMLSAPIMDSAPPPKRDRPSSDTRLALDAERSIPPKPAPRPAAPPQPASRSMPPASMSFSGSDAIPLPGTAPPPARAAMPPPAASPFDQIAAAAFAPPPPPPQVRPGPKEEDLLMPKGVDLDALAREAARQGPPKYEPADLPGLRAPFGSASISQSGLSTLPPSRSSQRPSGDLPGLKANDPAARMFEGQPTPQRRASDPWASSSLGVYSTSPPVAERLSVPDRVPSRPPAAPLSAPAGTPSSGPTAYDEEHYRVVYNDFVASKARLGEAVDNITYEGFRSKLRSSEEALINRHGCRAVRFQVLVKDNTVSLRPQLVR